MKRILFYIILSVCLFACKKNSSSTDKVTTKDSVEGKWKLTESLYDPGDGSGTWKAANPDNPIYLDFKNDGSLIFTPSGTNTTTHYQVLNDSVMIFLRGSEQLTYRYKLADQTLLLYPPCDEACGEKYIAIE